jgi:uncharacterized protein YyaL (SSP411 family)
VNDLGEQARLTLRRLVEGPLFDRRGGGIHRAAIAPGFGEIQYEKLLVQNAVFARELALAVAEADDPALRAALVGTTRFVREVLARAEGGFYLAQIADPASADGGAYWQGTSSAPPPLDPLVLAGPNAVAGSALLFASAVLDDDALAEHAIATLDFVLREAVSEQGAVRHVIAPAPSSRIFLETQADTALALVEAYEGTGDRRYLDGAAAAVGFARRTLADPDSAALVDHLADPARLGLLANPRWPLRPNVRLARALLRLSRHGFGAEPAEAARMILGCFSGDLSGFRVHGIEAALAIEEAIGVPLEIRISGLPSDARTRALRRAAWTAPGPWRVVLTAAGEGAGEAELAWRGKTTRVGTPEELRRALGAAR